MNSGNSDLLQKSGAYHTEQAVGKAAKAMLKKAVMHGGIGYDIGALLSDMEAHEIAYRQ